MNQQQKIGFSVASVSVLIFLIFIFYSEGLFSDISVGRLAILTVFFALIAIPIYFFIRANPQFFQRKK